jgi:hypothetical protein
VKKVLVKPFLVLLFFTSLLIGDIDYLFQNATVGNKWKPYHDTVKGEISYSHMDVILKGDGLNSGYILGAWEGLDGAWNQTDGKIISWTMEYSENYIVYIRIMTNDGPRYLYYTARDRDLGKDSDGTFIHHGLGSDSKDGSYHTFTRDLEADLQDFEPNNELVAINAFLLFGSGSIRYIKVKSPYIAFNGRVQKVGDTFADIIWTHEEYRYIEYGKDTDYGEIAYYEHSDAVFSYVELRINDLEPDTTYHYRISNGYQHSKDYTFKTTKKIVYEDAEDSTTNKWRKKSESSSIDNILIDNNSVIQISGSAVIGGWKNHPNAWHNKTHNTINWRMMTNNGFSINVRVMTEKGARYLYYTAVDKDFGINSSLPTYIHHGLGRDKKDGNWHTIQRNLETDLKDFEPKNKLLAVNGVFFQSNLSLNIDDITMKNTEEYNIYYYYFERNKMCIDTYLGNTTNGTKTVISNCNAQNNMKWIFKPIQNKYYQIINKKSNSCLEVPNNSDGVNVDIDTCVDNEDRMLWERIITRYSFVILKNKATGKYFTVDANKNIIQTESEVPLFLYIYQSPFFTFGL